jgi:hypothetical protein
MRIINKVIIFIFIFTTISFGQIENLKTHSQMSLDCKKCHICDTPTKANPCLVLCPRNKIEVERHSPEEGPINIIINKVIADPDLYGPSSFTHKLHAEMSLMSGGCAICHHFNPPGKIVSCSSCHENKRVRTDLSKPDLKAAFHRQCMGCHSTWEEKTECASCHALNSSNKKVESKPYIEKAHPPITIPKKIVYETESDEGSIVTFFHNDHSSLFGLECSDCHTEESCAKCHAKTKPNFASANEHDRCSACHDTEDNCGYCHKDNLAEPFNHKVKTGFALSGYHAGLSCVSCHKTKNKFTGLNKKCISCHANEDGYFNHDITGISLDETHIEFECESCHQSNNYSKKPSCIECHDEDISFPDSVPGERLK